MDKEKIIKKFWDLVDKFLYQFRKGLLTQVVKCSITVDGN
jgi:hypothetical protein